MNMMENEDSFSLFSRGGRAASDCMRALFPACWQVFIINGMHHSLHKRSGGYAGIWNCWGEDGGMKSKAPFTSFSPLPPPPISIVNIERQCNACVILSSPDEPLILISQADHCSEFEPFHRPPGFP